MHRKFRLFSPGKASSHSTLPRFFSFFLCAVFSCFRNPTNSDMDYRIFDVRTLLCVRIHTGWCTPTASRHNISTRKNSQFFLVLWMGFEPLVHWISRPMLYQLSHHIPLEAAFQLRSSKVTFNYCLSICRFVKLKATSAENVHIVLSCRY